MNHIAASAGNGCLFVFRMNCFLHSFHLFRHNRIINIGIISYRHSNCKRFSAVFSDCFSLFSFCTAILSKTAQKMHSTSESFPPFNRREAYHNIFPCSSQDFFAAGPIEADSAEALDSFQGFTGAFGRLTSSTTDTLSGGIFSISYCHAYRACIR